MIVQMHHENGTISTSTTPANTLILNQWQHVAVSYDGVDQVKMFVDGYQMMFNQPTAPSGSLEDNSDADIYFGNYYNLDKGFDGIVDENRIWNYFMDQNEIQEKMNKYLHGNENGLIHYWQINEGNGEEVFDLVGNNDGEINDANWCQGKELDPTGISNMQIPSSKLHITNYPNPFNPSTTIYFELSAKNTKNAKIEIYNLKGQKIRRFSIFNSQSSIVWNGTDQNDQPVSSGVYLYKLQTGYQQKSKKMLLMK